MPPVPTRRLQPGVALRRRPHVALLAGHDRGGRRPAVGAARPRLSHPREQPARRDLAQGNHVRATAGRPARSGPTTSSSAVARRCSSTTASRVREPAPDRRLGRRRRHRGDAAGRPETLAACVHTDDLRHALVDARARAGRRPPSSPGCSWPTDTRARRRSSTSRTSSSADARSDGCVAGATVLLGVPALPGLLLLGLLLVLGRPLLFDAAAGLLRFCRRS